MTLIAKRKPKYTVGYRMIELHEQGRTVRQIADALNRQPSGVRRFLKWRGLTPHHDPNAPPPRGSEINALIVELHLKGFDRDYIQEQTGVTLNQIKKTITRRLGRQGKSDPQYKPSRVRKLPEDPDDPDLNAADEFVKTGEPDRRLMAYRLFDAGQSDWQVSNAVGTTLEEVAKFRREMPKDFFGMKDN